MRKSIFIGLFSLIAFILISNFTLAQETQVEEKAAVANYQYVVKFICGQSEGNIVAKGKYFTAINVFNPTVSPSVPQIKKQFAIAEPKETPGKTSRVYNMSLPYNKALEIDCQDIRDHLISENLISPNRLFVKGFVIIQSSVKLDVVVVYTAAGMNGEVTSLDIEQVLPK